MSLLTIISLIAMSRIYLSLAEYPKEDELYRIQLLPGKDLVLTTNSNPCQKLIDYCTYSVNSSSTRNCLHRYQKKVLQEILAFSDMMSSLDLDEKLFMSCDEVLPPSVAAHSRNEQEEREFSDFYAELLKILQAAPSGDRKALEFFDLRQNEKKLSPYEEISLFSRAVLLHPNSTYIISRFGLAMMSQGHTKTATSIFQNAVNRGLWPNILQRPEWYFVPYSSSKAWEDPADYPFTSILEAGYATIRDELLANLNRQQIILSEDIANRGTVRDNFWKVMYLISPESGNFTSYASFFPETVKILKNCSTDFILAKYSAIKPGTHIKPHTGPSNDRLRLHLTLVHAGGARIRVGEEWRTWTEGKVLIFDSSWEHEVYHAGMEERIVMILDIWK